MSFLLFLHAREPRDLRYAIAFAVIALASFAAFLWACTIRWQLAGLLLCIYAFASLQFFRELHGLWYDYLEDKELNRASFNMGSAAPATKAKTKEH